MYSCVGAAVSWCASSCASSWNNRKAPILHRALGAGDHDASVEEPSSTTQGLLSIQELATKRRVRKRDQFQRNALHIACMNQPSLEVVHMLIELYPKAVEEHDKIGRLPLHLACSHNASFDVIEYLVQKYPEGVVELTDRGMTPLFCALENKASIDVVAFLVDQDKEALMLESYKLGRTPLHVAASRGATIEVLQLLLRERPEAVHQQDAWGKTPFACACSAAAEFLDEDHCQHMTEVLEILMDPSTIIEADRAGMLPLHLACGAAMNLENLELLLDEYPEAICTPDHNGRLPCHAACTNPRVTVECLDVLVSAFPEALRTFDKVGALPLHIAIQRKMPVDIILFLIESEEGAVRTREGSSQMYPLHLASRAGADPLVLERLADIYPKAIASVDANGNTIFHLACMQRQLTVDLAELLLDRCSYDVIRKVNEDQSLPLHLAAQYRASLPVLQLLIDHYPEGLLCKDKNGNIPLHKAFQATYTEMSTLVRMAQQNHRQLSKRNKRDQKPMDCASDVIKKRFRRARYWYNVRKAYCPICIRMK